VKKRVLFFIPSLGHGGAERVVTTLLKHLDRNQFSLTLVVINPRDSVLWPEVPRDVEVIKLGLGRVRYAIPKIICLVWKRRPDVVFSTLGHLNLVMAALRPLMPRKCKFIARESSIVSEVLLRCPRPRLLSWMYRRFYSKHDVVICQSQYMQKDLVENYKCPLLKTILINNPVDVRHIQGFVGKGMKEKAVVFQKKRTNLVAAGRLVAVKGFDLLVEAIAMLNTSSVSLTILGDGPQRARLEELVKEYRLEDRINLIGHQANPHIWFASADAVILSSHYEGFPNVALEALACGSPIIATPAIGGTTEILHDIPECVIAREISSMALAEAIEEWLEGPQQRVPLSAVRPYRVSKIIKEYEQLLAAV
jgi:glycosyltransferase involved in cell wall biosynthesis